MCPSAQGLLIHADINGGEGSTEEVQRMTLTIPHITTDLDHPKRFSPHFINTSDLFWGPTQDFMFFSLWAKTLGAVPTNPKRRRRVRLYAPSEPVPAERTRACRAEARNHDFRAGGGGCRSQSRGSRLHRLRHMWQIPARNIPVPTARVTTQ